MKNVEEVLSEGFRWVVSAPVRSYAALDRARAHKLGEK
jgi:hypothetical protein